jgi:hypothetical protein
MSGLNSAKVSFITILELHSIQSNELNPDITIGEDET